MAAVNGRPEMVGARGADTASEKAGRAASLVPSLTLRTMLAYVPTAPGGGVPDRVPLTCATVIQRGRFAAR